MIREARRKSDENKKERVGGAMDLQHTISVHASRAHAIGLNFSCYFCYSLLSLFLSLFSLFPSLFSLFLSLLSLCFFSSFLASSFFYLFVSFFTCFFIFFTCFFCFILLALIVLFSRQNLLSFGLLPEVLSIFPLFIFHFLDEVRSLRYPRLNMCRAGLFPAPGHGDDPLHG